MYNDTFNLGKTIQYKKIQYVTNEKKLQKKKKSCNYIHLGA